MSKPFCQEDGDFDAFDWVEKLHLAEEEFRQKQIEEWSLVLSMKDAERKEKARVARLRRISERAENLETHIGCRENPIALEVE